MAARAIKKASETEVVLPTRLLFEAVSKGELERVRELAIKNVNANHQEVPFVVSSPGVMRLNLGNQRHRGSHRTPIHQAAELGYLDICKVLCEEAQASIATVDKVVDTLCWQRCGPLTLDRMATRRSIWRAPEAITKSSNTSSSGTTLTRRFVTRSAVSYPTGRAAT